MAKSPKKKIEIIIKLDKVKIVKNASRNAFAGNPMKSSVIPNKKKKQQFKNGNFDNE